jgi:hypothetical protein
LLKWREITGRLNSEESVRWEEIRRTFGRNLLTGGAGQDDPMGRITGQLNAFNAGLERIGDAVAKPTLSEVTMERLASIIDGLRAVPVNVEIKVMPVEEGGGKAYNRPPTSEEDLPVVVESKVEQPGKR